MRQSARKRLSELPHLNTVLAHQRTSERRQDTARSVAAEHSGDVGATPASDSRCTAASHLGRAYAGAYRGDGECAGALGFELGALVWPAASGGACSGNGAWRNCCCCCASRGRRERRGRQNGGRVLGVRVGVPTRGVEVAGRGASNAGVRPPRGRRRVERGGRRAHGREGRGSGLRCPAGPKGRRVGPAAPVPFPFFKKKFFSQILSKFIWTI